MLSQVSNILVVDAETEGKAEAAEAAKIHGFQTGGRVDRSLLLCLLSQFTEN